MAEKQAQMALDLYRESRFSAEHFIAGTSNAAARAWLVREDWPEGRFWLWGATGTGKTHLLRVWASQRGADIGHAAALYHDKYGEIIFNGVPFYQGMGDLVIDHLEGLTDEVALLHLLNRARAEGKRVLMAARLPPARCHFVLPDLASRLRATVSVAIEEPEDQLRATLLLSLLAERQLVVSQPVTEWLWRHLPRTGEALVQAVERLDAVALERGVSITRALAKEILGI